MHATTAQRNFSVPSFTGKAVSLVCENGFAADMLTLCDMMPALGRSMKRQTEHRLSVYMPPARDAKGRLQLSAVM